MFQGVFGQSGITPETVEAFFKGTGIIGAAALMAFLMIRYKVIRLIAVDEATEWIRVKWDVARYHHFGKRRGRLIRLKQGRHLIIRGIYSGWEVPLKENPVVVEGVKQPYRKRTLLFDLITIGYVVIAPDTKKGDKTMLRSVLSLRDSNREDGGSENLDQKVKAITLTALGKVLKRAEPDWEGLPVLTESAVIKEAAKKLKKRHGVRLVSFEPSAPTWELGSQHYAAAVLIARAMGLSEEETVIPGVPPPGELYGLPGATSA
jgi:hypothetical protein